jgi:pSer/pThr/pTyr-binding forkhead associated (FHA) protein
MATLHILGIDELYPITLDQVGIGRAPDNEIVIDDETASIYHALITARQKAGGKDEEFILEDLDSTNHTYVNNQEIHSHPLRNGDIIRIGNTRLKFSTQKMEPPPDKGFEETRKIGSGTVSSYLHKK